jgi:hypothetical protein
MKQIKVHAGLPTLQLEALKAASTPNAVIWPRKCRAVRQYASGDDGRVHFEAPINDAFALYDAGFIDTHGCITDAGRAALVSRPHRGEAG